MDEAATPYALVDGRGGQWLCDVIDGELSGIALVGDLLRDSRLPVEDDALEAACGAFYYEWGEDEVDPEDAACCRREMRPAVEAVSRVIAAAVRADVRAKVLAEVETAIRARLAAATDDQWVGGAWLGEALTAVRALGEVTG
jgi:hypothetical protein